MRSDSLDLDLDERLPWLEADSDADEESRVGGRFGAVVLVALIALALVATLVWWLSGAGGPGEGDGSLVQAPAGPYKVRPESPGGKTFAGTGDSAYAVSQGERRPPALAAAGEPSGVAGSASVGAPAAGPAVQVGAFMDRETAEAAWAGLVQRAPVLSGFHHRVVEGRADIGTLYRLQVVTANLAAADQLCGTLRAAGQDCRVRP